MILESKVKLFYKSSLLKQIKLSVFSCKMLYNWSETLPLHLETMLAVQSLYLLIGEESSLEN